ncbi:MAG: hypothetical protein ACKOWN_04760 [Microbacteriaceae bacterium]
MGSGWGTTLTLILVGVLWLVYLAPDLRRKREFEANQKNTIRINQAMRAAARATEARKDGEGELSRREERIRERALRARARERAGGGNPVFAARSRSIKLGLTLVALVAAGATGTFGYAGEWTPTLVSLGVLGFAAVGLVILNGAMIGYAEAAAPRFTGLPEVDDTWTPIRTPKVHRSIPDGAGLIVTPETELRVAREDAAARIREQAARVVAESEPAIDPRFSELGPITEEVSAVDINAALRARRAQ